MRASPRAHFHHGFRGGDGCETHRLRIPSKRFPVFRSDNTRIGRNRKGTKISGEDSIDFGFIIEKAAWNVDTNESAF